MHCIRICALAVIIAIVAGFAPAHAQRAAEDATEETAATAPRIVEILTADGRRLRFDVAVADRAETRQRGLMFVEEMAPNAGMLFIFEDERQRAFWMRNTYIPLDIIYFDAEGRFVSVAAQAVPFDETSLPSAGPAQYVLEINGGWAAFLQIGPGSVLRSDALAGAGLGLSVE